MRLRGVSMLVLGLLLAGGSVIVAHHYLNSGDQRPGEAQAREISAIVVARSEIPFGVPIRFEMVRLQEWPNEAIPPEAFVSLEDVLVHRCQQKIQRNAAPCLRAYGMRVTLLSVPVH